jgi:hypothetical protein
MSLKKIHNAESNEVIEREMTLQEIEQKELDNAYAIKRERDEAQAELDKATAKAALLDRLGITADEAKLLLS